MDHYLELRLRPDPEFPAAHLMSALFTKLHRALVALPELNIGVSFPDVDEHRPSLGERLRLHGSHAALERLLQQSWLQGMRDHLSQSELLPIPAQVQYRQVIRVQAKSNPERLRRRQMRRHGLSEEEAQQAAMKRVLQTNEGLSEKEARERIDQGQRLTLPFIPLRSQSTGQPFHLFIRHSPVQPEPLPGSFNRYGLGNGATIPWF
jgi:CRISPR-associated endonuclease Csy4